MPQDGIARNRPLRYSDGLQMKERIKNWMSCKINFYTPQKKYFQKK